ncbi:MAG TPA: hypothetical protein EYN06_01370 [Myxococcales bacterium]|nr:hypothetical protein [Myxococcales bacterium]HIN85100.1 hypothetical protein [Myxococcales bacterium]
MSETVITEAQKQFLQRAVARKRLFWVLSMLGVAIGIGLATWFLWERSQNPEYALGTRMVLVVLILLNARQNLRQYKYAQAIEAMKEFNP